jgi:hypothetical protein
VENKEDFASHTGRGIEGEYKNISVKEFCLLGYNVV